jgi:hypothetical protein
MVFAIAQRRGPSVHSFLATFGTFNLDPGLHPSAVGGWVG